MCSEHTKRQMIIVENVPKLIKSLTGFRVRERKNSFLIFFLFLFLFFAINNNNVIRAFLIWAI